MRQKKIHLKTFTKIIVSDDYLDYPYIGRVNCKMCGRSVEFSLDTQEHIEKCLGCGMEFSVKPVRFIAEYKIEAKE